MTGKTANSPRRRKNPTTNKSSGGGYMNGGNVGNNELLRLINLGRARKASNAREANKARNIALTVAFNEAIKTLKKAAVTAPPRRRWLPW